MKNIAAILLLFICWPAAIVCHAQRCAWAQGTQGVPYFVRGGNFSIAADNAGNSYESGCYVDFISFGSTVLYSAVPGAMNIFLVKYDPAGNLVWAQTFGGIYEDVPTAITTDRQGNVYLYGLFSSPAVVFGADTLTPTSPGDFFLTKFRSDGSVQWAISQPTSYSGDPYQWNLPSYVRTDALGGVVVSGSYRSTLRFPGTTLSNPSGEGGCYIARYDTAGNFLWARSSHGYVNCYGTSVTSDNAGNIYAAGYAVVVLPAISYYMTFGFGADSVTLATGWYIYLTKYDVNGNELSFTTITNGYGGDIADMGTDKIGNLYMTGYVDGDPLNPIMFDTLALHDTSFNLQQFFLVKYNSAGHALWAKSTSGDTDNVSVALTVDSNGNAVIAGSSFITKYTTEGRMSWNIDLTAHPTIEPVTLSRDDAGDIFLSGIYLDTVAFDSCRLVAIPAGAEQICALKFSDLTEAIPSIASPATDIELFPVPATNELYVRSAGQQINEVDITDMLGHTVFRKSTSNTHSLEIDVSNLSPAVYIARINNVVVKKFVKE